jgi:hypothetical protein
MILKEKLDFDLLESLDVKEFMQIHILRLILSCTYESIDFQDDNDKDVHI